MLPIEMNFDKTDNICHLLKKKSNKLTFFQIISIYLYCRKIILRVYQGKEAIFVTGSGFLVAF
jgi:hypothetical protein